MMRLAAVSEVTRQYVEDDKVPGAVVAVSQHGKLIHFDAQGVMNPNDGAAMRDDAIFRMASSTKPVLGVAAMMMIEDGLFDPHDPVSQYIPEFENIQVAVLADPVDEDVSPEYLSLIHI